MMQMEIIILDFIIIKLVIINNGNASISFENINQDVENGLLEENNETNKGIWETLKNYFHILIPFLKTFLCINLLIY